MVSVRRWTVAPSGCSSRLMCRSPASTVLRDDQVSLDGIVQDGQRRGRRPAPQESGSKPHQNNRSSASPREISSRSIKGRPGHAGHRRAGGADGLDPGTAIRPRAPGSALCSCWLLRMGISGISAPMACRGGGTCQPGRHGSSLAPGRLELRVSEHDLGFGSRPTVQPRELGATTGGESHMRIREMLKNYRTRKARKRIQEQDDNADRDFTAHREHAIKIRDKKASAAARRDALTIFLQSASPCKVSDHCKAVVDDLHYVSEIYPETACMLFVELAADNRSCITPELENDVFRSWLRQANSDRIYETWSHLVRAAGSGEADLIDRMYSIAREDISRVAPAFTATGQREAAESAQRRYGHKPYGKSLGRLISMITTELIQSMTRSRTPTEHDFPIPAEPASRPSTASFDDLGRCLPPDMPPR